MKKLILLPFLIGLTACGYSSVENELISQPKKIFHQTPIFCPDRVDVDVSMGVMRNGVGSMSNQDVFLNVPNEKDVKTLEKAISEGKLVKIKYNVYRVVWCQPDDEVVSVEILDSAADNTVETPKTVQLKTTEISKDEVLSERESNLPPEINMQPMEIRALKKTRR
jgi:hypothetical protein